MSKLVFCANPACATQSETPMQRKGWAPADLPNAPLNASKDRVSLCNACGLLYTRKWWCPHCTVIYRKQAVPGHGGAGAGKKADTVSEGQLDNYWISCSYCPAFVHYGCQRRADPASLLQHYPAFACPECRRTKADMRTKPRPSVYNADADPVSVLIPGTTDKKVTLHSRPFLKAGFEVHTFAPPAAAASPHAQGQLLSHSGGVGAGPGSTGAAGSLHGKGQAKDQTPLLPPSPGPTRPPPGPPSSTPSAASRQPLRLAPQARAHQTSVAGQHLSSPKPPLAPGRAVGPNKTMLVPSATGTARTTPSSSDGGEGHRAGIGTGAVAQAQAHRGPSPPPISTVGPGFNMPDLFAAGHVLQPPGFGLGPIQQQAAPFVGAVPGEGTAPLSTLQQVQQLQRLIELAQQQSFLYGAGTLGLAAVQQPQLRLPIHGIHGQAAAGGLFDVNASPLPLFTSPNPVPGLGLSGLAGGVAMDFGLGPLNFPQLQLGSGHPLNFSGFTPGAEPAAVTAVQAPSTSAGNEEPSAHPSHHVDETETAATAAATGDRPAGGRRSRKKRSWGDMILLESDSRRYLTSEEHARPRYPTGPAGHGSHPERPSTAALPASLGAAAFYPSVQPMSASDFIGGMALGGGPGSPTTTGTAGGTYRQLPMSPDPTPTPSSAGGQGSHRLKSRKSNTPSRAVLFDSPHGTPLTSPRPAAARSGSGLLKFNATGSAASARPLTSVPARPLSARPLDLEGGASAEHAAPDVVVMRPVEAPGGDPEGDMIGDGGLGTKPKNTKNPDQCQFLSMGSLDIMQGTGAAGAGPPASLPPLELPPPALPSADLDASVHVEGGGVHVTGLPGTSTGVEWATDATGSPPPSSTGLQMHLPSFFGPSGIGSPDVHVGFEPSDPGPHSSAQTALVVRPMPGHINLAPSQGAYSFHPIFSLGGRSHGGGTGVQPGPYSTYSAACLSFSPVSMYGLLPKDLQSKPAIVAPDGSSREEGALMSTGGAEEGQERTSPIDDMAMMVD